MKTISTLLLLLCPCVLLAQTYSTKSQGSNNSAGGAYVAPVITRTFTMPSYAPAISSPGKAYSGNSYSSKNVTREPAPTTSTLGELYMPRQSASDKAKNNKCLSGDCINGIGTRQGTPGYGDYRYVGPWKNGERNGIGKCYDWEGYLLFEGMFVDGVKTGYGREVSYRQERITDKQDPILPYNTSLEFVYEGMFKDFRYEGKGTLDEYNKQQVLESNYQGNFKNGVKEGEGTLISFLGYGEPRIIGFYVGNWEKGERSGKGVDSSSAGLYVGDFASNLKNGEGVTFWPIDAEKGTEPVAAHVGLWKMGYKSGEGTEYDKTGKMIYEGNFAKDKRDGQGKMYNPDGSFTTGNWVEGFLQGFGTDFSKDGKMLYAGNFKNNLRSGDGQFYKPDGTSVKGIWVNGFCKELGVEAGEGKFALKEINDNFKKGNINKWEIDPTMPSKIEFKKDVMCISSTSNETSDRKITLPGLLLFEDDDDWTFEATARLAGSKFDEWGIGWDGGGIHLFGYLNRCYFKYFYNEKSEYASNPESDYKQKEKWNTVRIEKNGTAIVAFLNGKKIYTGVTGRMSTKGLYLIIKPAVDNSLVEFKEVIFKKH